MTSSWRWRRWHQPVIAEVNGPADRRGPVAMALAADIRVAFDQARLLSGACRHPTTGWTANRMGLSYPAPGPSECPGAGFEHHR